MKRYYLLLIGLLFVLFSFAQDNVVFTGEAPSVVELGERFRIVYSVNASGRGFHTPDLNDFDVLVGPSTSSSSSVQYINGAVSKNYQITYTFIVQPKKEGVFKISPATITVDDKEYSSNEISIEVVKGASSNSTAASKATSNNSNRNSDTEISDKDVFIRYVLSKSSLYQGEHTVASVKLYSRNPNLQPLGFRPASANGFWSEEIALPVDKKWTSEKYNDKVYNTVVLKKEVLFPQHSGKIIIPEAEMDVKIYVQVKSRSPFDDFFGATQAVNKTLRSPKVTLNVKELPAPQPTDFGGSVGDFKLTSSVDKDSLNANEAVTLKVTISGTGNLKLVNAPKIAFPADFEVYEPKTIENFKTTESGQIGSKTFEYLVIPRYGGEYTIPAADFVYFDLNEKEYKKISGNEFTVKVKQTQNSNSQIVSGINKEDVKYLNKDIRFINTTKTRLVPVNQFFVNQMLFYLLYPVVFIILFITYLLRKKYINENINVVIVKNRKANKMARRRLKNAEILLKKNQTEAFYEETLKALWGYLGDKLMIPTADLSKEKVSQKLQEKGIGQELIDSFKEIVSTCEFARFAPAKEAQNMETTFKLSVELISNIDQKIK